MLDEDNSKATARRWIASLLMVALSAACVIYIVRVIQGVVAEAHRLKAVELGMAVVAAVLLILAIYPEALDSLSLVSLPGGVKVTLRRIKKRQEEQGEALEAVFRVISGNLIVDEKHYLRDLARESPPLYNMTDDLKERFKRLIRFGLIREVQGQRLDAWFNGVSVLPTDYVELTPTGRKFVFTLKTIEE